MLKLPLQLHIGMRIVETQTIPLRAAQKRLLRAQQRPAGDGFWRPYPLRPFDDDPFADAAQPPVQTPVVRLQSDIRLRRDCSVGVALLGGHVGS